MSKFFCSLLFVLAMVSISAQDTMPETTDPKISSLSFTSGHRSFSFTYGLTAPLGLSYYNSGKNASTAPHTNGSFSTGPIEALYNLGIGEKFEFQIGVVGMYHRDAYQYTYETSPYNIQGYTNLVFGGGIVGFNYHFVNRSKADPYIGVASGVGYFWGSRGENDLGLRRKTNTIILFNPKVGVHLYSKKNAWTIEGGYDYFSYLKVGYTIIKHK